MSVDISERIFVLRGQRVLLDVDLATLYGVETRRLNEQVRRNRHRFPSDFVFEINQIERANLMSQIATSSWGGHRKPPMAFTEHGAIMAATVLNSPRAVDDVRLRRPGVRQAAGSSRRSTARSGH